MNFVVPADHKVKQKENLKNEKYIDLATKLKNLRNMNMTVIPTVIGVLGAVTKGLVQGLGVSEIRG